jgi:DNA-binding transcriptional ArsR family regulator
MTEKEIQKLLKIAGSVFKVDVFKPTRQRDHVQARMIVMKILKDNGYSYSKVGNILGKSHCNVIHHLKDFDFQLKYDAHLHKKYERVKLEMSQRSNIILQLSHDELIKYTFSLEDRLKKITLSTNRNKNYENLFKFIQKNVPESNLTEAKQRLKDLTHGLYN